VSIVLYWTFLGLSAPYEVVERSCAFFCILIYFTRYKMYMCVGIGWSLNLLPFSNQLPSCDFRWPGHLRRYRYLPTGHLATALFDFLMEFQRFTTTSNDWNESKEQLNGTTFIWPTQCPTFEHCQRAIKQSNRLFSNHTSSFDSF